MDKEHEEKKDTGEQEVLDFTKPDFSFTPKGNHEWQQRGYYLVCQNCELEHAIFIGALKIMVGVDDSGQPLLKTRKELGMV